MTSTETPTNHNTDLLTDFAPKNKFAKSEDCPVTESELNWIFKKRKDNGFSKAFVKINSKKFLVHIPSFIQRLNARRGA